jgi:beta-galactosidase
VNGGQLNGSKPEPDHTVRFHLSGPCDIVATDNGDATSHVPFKHPARAYNGRAIAIVRRRALRADSDGLTGAAVTLRCGR